MDIKNVTVGQFIDAIELNGYEQEFGLLLDTDEEGTIISACAMGQGLLNIGLSPYEVYNYAISIDAAFYARVVDMNDFLRMPLKEIASSMRLAYQGLLDRPVFVFRSDPPIF